MRTGGKGSEHGTVSVGGVNFYDEHDLLLWIEKYLPPSSNFGAFIDVYGLLARFVTHKGNGLAKDMEVRAKVYITSSEEILIETFQHLLPLIFGKVAAGTSVMALAGEKASMFPGMKSEQS